MNETIEQLLVRNLREVFGERDPVRRRAAIASLYAPEAVFADYRRSHRGWDGVDEAAAGVQAATPGFVFAMVGEAQVAEGAGRLRWAYGPPEDPRRVTGTDFALVREGRIIALYVFLDPPA
ncbi:nuclear transport factor 2 family protein [Azorhizobium doebereinerae]|uniref:nuclear transport factor 2 family protein n=1 Tax=Azorhizobium doebereinerae TaxID=281091 RepID=UPI0003FDB86C|nr:nuclear transport factor 2 family protein [Azorhizobium doebereinerae]